MTISDQINPPLLPFSCNSNSRESIQRCLSLLSTCSSSKQLFQIHAQIIISGLHQNSYLADKIIQFCTWDLYRRKIPVHLIVNHARSVIKFSKNLKPSSWNDLIRAYATSNCDSATEALWVFLDMRRLGITPNEHTFPFLFKSCASFLGLNEGRQIHADVVKHGLQFNVYVGNTTIHFYGSCKKIIDAYRVFDEMPDRTLVSWNSIISACADCSWFYNSIELFVKMGESGFDPDETTMVIVLSTCAEIGNLSMGKWVHSQVILKGMFMNCQLGTALVDMYGKCGYVSYASLVFDRMLYRNVWSWSAMILGFAQHGYAIRALELFKEMSNHPIKPNHVTFLGVLCACSHTGLVEDGKYYFKKMEHLYGIKPKMVHFGAMVDTLGRAGLLKEAYDFVMKMPFEADSIVWRTLLSACTIHDVNDNVGVGEKVRSRLIELEPKRSGNLVMISNNYAEVGLWDKAERLRSRMMDKGLKKIAGESCLEVSGSIFRFFSGDYSCIACEDVFSLLNRINKHMKMVK